MAANQPKVNNILNDWDENRMKNQYTGGNR